VMRAELMPIVAVVKSDLAPEAVRENTKRAIDKVE